MSDLIHVRSVIDLTHNLNNRCPNWEGTEVSPYKAEELGNIERDGYFSRTFSTQEHYGTHLDAPAHFAAGAWTVEQIPAERLVRPLVVLDVREHVKKDEDYAITADDISQWEHLHGPVPFGAVVLACTGWEERWAEPISFRNQRGDGLTHYPGYSLEAAEFLVTSRGVVGLGIDTMSVDIGVTATYPVHLFTSKQSIYHLENVANLGTVPASGATIVVAPIKLENGSGGPVRLFALLG